MFDEMKAKAKEIWDNGKEKAKSFYAEHPEACQWLSIIAGCGTIFGTGLTIGKTIEEQKNEMWRRGINNGLKAGSGIYEKALQQANGKEDENN